MSVVKVIRTGLASSIQDLGREHLRHFGVAAGGAADQLSHELANRLVGNSADAATLEMTLTGDELLWTDDSMIAIAGAEFSPVLMNDSAIAQPVPQRRPVLISAGTQIRFQAARRGCRCYVAVRGGFDVPIVMGSRSTYLRASIGGMQGRYLQAGDCLPVVAKPLTSGNSTPPMPPGTLQSVPWFVRPIELPDPELATLRVVKGAHFGRLSAISQNAFFERPFRISPQSDRMGCRLSGVALMLQGESDITTEGTAPGTIQLPPDGNPILLMADCAPTGGYPRIGHVVSADLPTAAQLRPGQLVKFREIDLITAQQAVRQQRQQFDRSVLFASLTFEQAPLRWTL